MNINYLDFEQPIADLLAHIEELKRLSTSVGDNVDLSKELKQLEKKNVELTKKLYSSLSAWQISQLSRHPMRPYTLDYVSRIFTDFQELAGDRAFADDKAIIGGMARLDGMPVMIIGHQKGRDTKERTLRNFGMPRPEGYRKAMRLMRLAERFHVPVLTFIDTPGAYPGVGAEERSQAGAIAESLKLMSDLKVPVICTVIGEGGSGGALAIGVGDRVNMLQYSTYSVISPEGCASILWKSAEKASLAAEAMNITADKVKSLGLIDEIVPEPLGGAHRDYDAMAANLKSCILRELEAIKSLSVEECLQARFDRLMSFGYC
ncbi:acetyl-CoA carboxylase carboxyl transferase subunit alpha [Anaerobiospirillum sp. NML120448]|uniref:acetyl-CoA carboxylase carboxyl transferase subunit alpha n=1 Tax=Anaerobiospirillum sp. NML120448 TaxID=2932816 RepID=UPI001FF4992D|nr:acetyl-CoA carboxylase carboxyl transferase subunit alpha [Anaerobiospirillum sp. NML120448]MCK0514791.1 acetyl-CoA carboxylase carboxyl transferase subunit alpha [Anaerobiospirillum sp. NML120448]